MKVAVAIVLGTMAICCVATSEDSKSKAERRSSGSGSDQTLPRLGDLVPDLPGILNQDCKHMQSRACRTFCSFCAIRYRDCLKCMHD